MSVIAISLAASNASSAQRGITWPDGQALPSFARPHHLHVADVVNLSAEEKLLFITLQGIVNRTRPRIFLLQGGEEGNTTWLSELAVETTELQSPWDLFLAYRDEVRGTVVFDPRVPDSINVATTLSGLEDAVVASPGMAEILSAAPYWFPVIEDLRERRFSGRVDSYRWQLDNLWPRVSQRMLVGLPPRSTPSVHLGPLGAINVPLAPVWDALALEAAPFPTFRDYAVANRAMVVWLDPNHPLERALFAEILAKVADGSPYLGWFPGDVAGELAGVELVSSHELFVVPADHFHNMTVFSGARSRAPRPVAPPPPQFENKIYVTFTMSDGDNLQYDQHRLRVIWDNAARGSVPINWTISSLLPDAAPSLWAYYRRTATDNDFLIAGPSGAGYVNPGPWPDATFHLFTEQTGAYRRRAGMNTLNILNNQSFQRRALTEAEAAAYILDAEPAGLLLNWFLFPECRTENVMLDGTTPASTGCLVNSRDEARFDLFRMSQGWDGNSPRFLSIGFIAWSVTPAEVAQVVASLDDRYRIVRADHYFDLIRQVFLGNSAAT